ncbi:hypothetical protein FRB93_006710 [Tulasnella sp. JGI-2019a]|nr:hypothetical protein FRB93_006710 [Tulasnella sp. JGI-2019a]
MHFFTTLALPIIIVATTAAAASDAPTSPSTSNSNSRRSTTGLFRDIHNIIFRRQSKRSKRLHSSSSLHKRGAVNAGKQCVLQAASNPLSGASGKGTTTTTKTTTAKGGSTTTASGSTSTSTWKKEFDASGSNFFDQWTFWSDADPTHGNVQFTTSSQASSGGLTSIDSNGYAVMKVDTTPVVASGNRMSVRIQSNESWNGGLFLMDATHMPVGCGVWPAWWTVGPNWPNNGEIDIVEGVNMNTYNQCSFHTADGCTITSDFGGSGDLVAETDCSANLTGNQGCGIRSTNPASYGAGFNAIGGGVYAMLWDANGINVWFFNRTSIPKDITSEAPVPTSWGLPTARWPATTCDPNTYVHNHNAIFDTTLCGDWAGGAWATAPNGGGQSCAQSTGAATCAEYVAGNGAAFADAYWTVKSVKVYQSS